MKIIYMGTPDFALPALKALHEKHQILALVTQPDKKQGRKQTLIEPPTKQFAKTVNIPIFQPKKVSEITDDLLALKPDIIITAAFGQFLPSKLIETPPLKAINIHASLLPELRGGAPIQRAIERGYKTTGISIIIMSKKMDAGPIIAQKSIAIKPDETAKSLFDKLATLGKDVLLESLPLYHKGEVIAHEQDHKKATYAYTIKREEEKLDFNMSAIELERKIRAFYDSPATYLTLEDGPLKVYQANVVKTHSDKTPGQVIEHTEKGPVIKCASNALELITVKPAGKKTMPAVQYMHGKGKKTLAKDKILPL